MGKNERATFVVTVDGVVGDAGKDDEESSSGPTTAMKLPPRRCLEYDISLDDWIEEIDLSEEKDSSLVKRVMRDGDGVTRPVEIAGITLRCVFVRTSGGCYATCRIRRLHLATTKQWIG